jgi:hypothetical protein
MFGGDCMATHMKACKQFNAVLKEAQAGGDYAKGDTGPDLVALRIRVGAFEGKYMKYVNLKSIE